MTRSFAAARPGRGRSFDRRAECKPIHGERLDLSSGVFLLQALERAWDELPDQPERLVAEGAACGPDGCADGPESDHGAAP